MSSKFDLLSLLASSCGPGQNEQGGGCSAKLPPQMLDELLKGGLGDTGVRDERLLVGVETHDDATVWKVNSSTAIIQTTDFFPPVCSDPYEFGQIAAANALSDVYAMGGSAVLALNIVMFPSSKVDLGVLRDILAGGASKVAEANASLAGGHTIEDLIPKYGLAVTGIVHPEHVITNKMASPGDDLILCKPLGTGVLMAAHKIGEAGKNDYQNALDSMKFLNDKAAGIMQRYGIKCATDITGFGLLGHALKMAGAAQVVFEINARKVPSLSGVLDLLDQGCIPGAAFRNLSFVEKSVAFDPLLDHRFKMLAVDAQTSGGIFMCAPPDRSEEIIRELKQAGYVCAVNIGKVREKGESFDGKFIHIH